MTTKAKIFSINRLRMGTDGKGITTLIGFHGCPLKCKYCINPECHNKNLIKKYTSKDVYEIVKKDRLYYLATGGGITFGGGEPLLHTSFIIDVIKNGAYEWRICIETSLNVPYRKWKKLVKYVDEFIVDIKDTNNKIYSAYTDACNKTVLRNLFYLSKCGLANKVTIRLPLIEGYNTKKDIIISEEKLKKMGYSKFDVFNYTIKEKDKYGR